MKDRVQIRKPVDQGEYGIIPSTPSFSFGKESSTRVICNECGTSFILIDPNGQDLLVSNEDIYNLLKSVGWGWNTASNELICNRCNSIE